MENIGYSWQEKKKKKKKEKHKLPALIEFFSAEGF